ncbi:acyltransferase [Ferruginibacter lapsinanis]|uniref:acyltransferase family protein n=1 Tax=Ferruginibacter lapsinanis TaxID=563172 RepID=UPI001E5B3F29|nr:acyltransferase [Ferruginibacter lapsinanis]UEG49012.1 acyltransferase [Ferruginibacter lapsinanis]
MSAKVHFSGLDGLRFISITFVVLHHLFTFKANFGFTAIDLPVLGTIGYYGIQFFFAGSGFLITYLLLREYGKYNTISLRSFYARRILRIWPAYYLLIILALVVVLKYPFFNIPDLTDTYLQSNFQKGNLLYFLFLPHIVPFSFPTTPYVHQTYTIGIEEQFYFIWGMIFFLIPKLTKRVFIGVLLGIVVINFSHDYFYEVLKKMEHIKAVDIFLRTATYIKYCRFSTFAIGSLFAFAFFQHKKWIQVFKSVYFQLFVYALLVSSIWFDLYIPYCRDEYISLIMLCVFGIAAFKETSIINYSASWLSFLGKVSYGIYLFHIFAIIFAIKICNNVFHLSFDNYTGMSLLIIVAMLLSVLFGIISYYTIEKFFLQIKKRFEKV